MKSETWLCSNTVKHFLCVVRLFAHTHTHIVLRYLLTTRLYRRQAPRLTSDYFTCCHTETERGDRDLCLSRSHYTDTDPTSRKRACDSNSRPPEQELHALPTEPPHLFFKEDKFFSPTSHICWIIVKSG